MIKFKNIKEVNIGDVFKTRCGSFVRVIGFDDLKECSVETELIYDNKKNQYFCETDSNFTMDGHWNPGYSEDHDIEYFLPETNYPHYYL